MAPQHRPPCGRGAVLLPARPGPVVGARAASGRACAVERGTARSWCGAEAAGGAALRGWEKHQDENMDNIKTVKEEWMCKSRTDDQILNGTEQNHDYFVNDLFEEAQKIGAICVSPTTVKNQVDVIIKLWKNGFTVNDGELRSYTDVGNQQFLDSIKKGELPFELQKVFEKEEVDVKVEDRKEELYLSSKKPIFHPFSGHGYRLGRLNKPTFSILSSQGRCSSPSTSLWLSMKPLQFINIFLLLVFYRGPNLSSVFRCV
ncbi:UBX domain-containing protein 2A isoform X3 [Meleagris gallopavo]|uniref:UBX domain-containing protein 2A isoform X3 n=1 Tax=Meleagris gallopavo TaxID=9103 RepID=UPI0012AC3805|nr:UBX domain-containing protein 2A isoform X3 [Meleagris gallopavo]